MNKKKERKGGKGYFLLFLFVPFSPPTPLSPLLPLFTCYEPNTGVWSVLTASLLTLFFFGLGTKKMPKKGKKIIPQKKMQPSGPGGVTNLTLGCQLGMLSLIWVLNL